MYSIRSKLLKLLFFFTLVFAGFSSPLAVKQYSTAWAGSTTVTLTATQKRRAQILFRNYCMDCHGPKLTGESFDKALLCPNVQGKDAGSYQDAVKSGPGEMPAFQVYTYSASDGNLILNRRLPPFSSMRL